mmetsp:Transcript_52443/g.114747  ORF Transcript_52443/g.114747 Transcript_52443/m.114747 type:complete len:115 (-) Transcript_52443:4642-4986(-)
MESLNQHISCSLRKMSSISPAVAQEHSNKIINNTGVEVLLKLRFPPKVQKKLERMQLVQLKAGEFVLQNRSAITLPNFCFGEECTLDLKFNTGVFAHERAEWQSIHKVQLHKVN